MPRAKLAAEIHLIVFDLIVTDSGCWPFLEMFPIPQSPTPSHLDGRPCLLVVFFILSLRGFASTLLHRNIFLLSIPYLVAPLRHIRRCYPTTGTSGTKDKRTNISK